MKVHFNHALDNLRMMLAELAANVEVALSSSVHAVKKLAKFEALDVIENQRGIDESGIEIEEECLKLFALYQPVAAELRQVVSICKVANELRRIGDLAVNMVERIEDMNTYGGGDCEVMDFTELSQNVYTMLHESLDAMVYHDSDRAHRVIASDGIVDKLHHENYGKVLDWILRFPKHGQYYLSGLTISRCLERIGDIAVRIAVNVIYVESGKIIRHCPDTGSAPQ